MPQAHIAHDQDESGLHVLEEVGFLGLVFGVGGVGVAHRGHEEDCYQVEEGLDAEGDVSAQGEQGAADRRADEPSGGAAGFGDGGGFAELVRGDDAFEDDEFAGPINRPHGGGDDGENRDDCHVGGALPQQEAEQPPQEEFQAEAEPQEKAGVAAVCDGPGHDAGDRAGGGGESGHQAGVRGGAGEVQDDEGDEDVGDGHAHFIAGVGGGEPLECGVGA